MNTELSLALVTTLCLLTFVICVATCLHHCFILKSRKEPYTHILSLVYGYIGAIIAYSYALLRILNVSIPVRVPGLYTLSILLCAVFLYRFLWLITRTGKPERFSRWHYIVAILTVLFILFFIILPIPVERRELVMSSMDILRVEEPWREIGYQLTPIMFMVYLWGYGVAGILRMRRYQRVIVNYSADEERTDIRWISYFFFLMLFSSFAPVLRLSYYWGYTFPAYLLLIIIPAWELLLVYNAIRGNYILIAPSSITTLPAAKSKEPYEVVSKEVRTAAPPIDKDNFEKYMQEKKPYLNAGLCITDLLPDLGTNRTYLSNFINKEYGVNFKTLINNYRLDELERLRNNGKKNQDLMDLVMKAGFGSYRSFLIANRRKYEEDKLEFDK
jgi:AraC-like DNA-binding protein